MSTVGGDSHCKSVSPPTRDLIIVFDWLERLGVNPTIGPSLSPSATGSTGITSEGLSCWW